MWKTILGGGHSAIGCNSYKMKLNHHPSRNRRVDKPCRRIRSQHRPHRGITRRASSTKLYHISREEDGLSRGSTWSVDHGEGYRNEWSCENREGHGVRGCPRIGCKFDIVAARRKAWHREAHGGIGPRFHECRCGSKHHFTGSCAKALSRDCGADPCLAQEWADRANLRRCCGWR